jgi:hypothetical protein
MDFMPENINLLYLHMCEAEEIQVSPLKFLSFLYLVCKKPSFPISHRGEFPPLPSLTTHSLWERWGKHTELYIQPM